MLTTSNTISIFMMVMNILIHTVFVTVATKPDPNAPRPEGQTLRPVTGESLQVVLINLIHDQ